jgi:guanine deaminase
MKDLNDHSQDMTFLRQTICMASNNVKTAKGGPFAAVIVKDGIIIATGSNLVTSSCDPTAHAEITAIRNACQALQTFRLTDCTIYSSCEPCPMCLAAIYWARCKRLVFAASQKQAAKAGFDDAFLYKELTLDPLQRSLPAQHLPLPTDNLPFDTWACLENKIPY